MHIADKPKAEAPDTYRKLREQAEKTVVPMAGPDSEEGGNASMSSTRIKRSAKKTKRGSRIAKIFLGIIVFLLALAAAGVVAGSVLVSSWLEDLPAYADIDDYASNGITTIYAADEETILATVYLENRIKVDSADIPQTMKDAIVAIEDERFYEHQGVDLYAVARALISNLRGGGQGGSTLTQQLVRNTVLLDEMQDRTVERKVREMYIAHEIEKTHSKDELLTLYLNVVNFGDGCYGVEAAARDYFGKHASELTLSECALLAAIPNSPSANNPRADFERAWARAKLVLGKMLELGYITQEEHDKALKEKPEIVEEAEEDYGVVKAPYFVDYVKDLAANDPKYNASNYKKGGLTIYTTLDMGMQEAAEYAVTEGISGWDGMDSSLTSVDPDNGYIKAMVGGKSYEDNPFNLSVQMRRQPGSCFKPFTLMAAMTAGCSPDTKIQSNSPCKVTDTWTVVNSEGEGYGMMSIKDATTHSVNTVYAQLAHKLGAQPIVDMAKACGITSPLSPVESICLGSQGVCTLEMASAYATLAAGGIHHEPVAITKVVDQNNNIVYEHEDDEGTRVMSEEMAAKTTEILRTVIEKGTGTRGKPSNGQPLAGKTGTSEEARDLWFVGYCPQLSTAIWSGYRDEQPTSGYGGSVSGPIFKIYSDQGVLGDIEYFPDVDTSSLKFTDEWKF